MSISLLYILTVEDETTMLSENIRQQSPTVQRQCPRRRETSYNIMLRMLNNTTICKIRYSNRFVLTNFASVVL